MYSILLSILILSTRKSKSVVVCISCHPGYLVVHIISKYVMAVPVLSLYVQINLDQPTSVLVVVTTLIIDLGLYPIPIISTHSLVHQYIPFNIIGGYNTVNIFHHFYLGNCHFIDVLLKWRYMCNRYNLIAGPVQILVTRCLLPIQYSME